MQSLNLLSLCSTLRSAEKSGDRDHEHAPAERRDAAAQGLLAPDPVRRAAHARAGHGRRTRRVLERLLDALFVRGHKVLVFLQFVTMLDVIEVCGIPFTRSNLINSLRTIGLGVRVQRLAIVSHQRLDRPTGVLRRDGPFPERRQRARCATSVPLEHSRRRARRQPDRSRHSRVLRPRLGA
jgi:hypothetical protein